MEQECFQLLILPRYRPTFPVSKEGSKKAIKIVNLHNGKKDVYRSVYNYVREADGQNALIDKIFVDFDPDENGKGAIKDARTLSKYLQGHKIRHAVYFSGRGAHLYIYTHPIYAYEMNNAGIAIRNYVRELADETGVNPDWKPVGDLRRVSRLPNTMNMKTHLYCIPLAPSEIDLSREEIEEKAREQRIVNPVQGENLIDIRTYDSVDPKFEIIVPDTNNVELGEDVCGVPPCVEVALKNGNAGYQERFMVITALRDLAYSQRDTENILEKYLTEEKFIHCTEEENQVDYIYSRNDLFFPSCKTIKANGFCIGNCEGCNIYY